MTELIPKPMATQDLIPPLREMAAQILAVLSPTRNVLLQAATELEELIRLREQNDVLIGSLEALLNHYVGLVNSGDCGSWDPENEDQVKRIRNYLANARSKGCSI